MDNLIDLIFENPVFLIVIIGGLISLFKGKGKQEEQQKKQEEQQRQQKQSQQQPQQARTTTPVSRPPQRQRTTHSERVETISNVSIEEQRAAQMKRFANSLATNQHSGMTDRPKIADARREEEIQKLTSKYNHEKFKRQFENSLTNKGLINSVIMAEVLGSPRARNPYQSVIAKRKSL